MVGNVYFWSLFHLLELDVFSLEDPLGHSPASIQLANDYFLVKSISLQLHELLVLCHAAVYEYLLYAVKLRETDVVM